MESQALVASKEQEKQLMQARLEESGVSVTDLVVPRLLLMQNTSEYVGDGKAKLGDVVNSQTLEVIGGLDKPVEVIPLKIYKTWVVMDTSTKQAEFVRTESWTLANSKREWEGMENGKPVRYDLCYNLFVLLKSDVDNKEAFPAVVGFRRTSSQAGKQVATQLLKMAALSRPGYAQTLNLSVRKEKKETNTYAVFSCAKGGDTDASGCAEATRWLSVLSAMKVDEKAEHEVVNQAKAIFSEDIPGDVL